MKLIQKGVAAFALALGFLLPMTSGAQDQLYDYDYGDAFSSEEYDYDYDWIENEYEWQEDDLFSDGEI